MNFMTQYSDIIYNKMFNLNQWDKRKIAMFGLERAYKSYCQFSNKKSWNRKKEYRILFDMFWDVLFKEKLLDEAAWKYHEEFRSENENIYGKMTDTEKYDEYNLSYANIFAEHVEEMLNCLIDDGDNEEAFLLLYIDHFIINYLCDVYEKKHNLIYKAEERENLYQSDLVKQEIKSQFDDIDHISTITNYASALKWIEQSSALLGYWIL